jgi:ATP-dependent protease HslVU (ClpYQ) peptidase subunit
MTTIVALVKNGSVIMGADTQVTDDDRRNNHIGMEKITKNNGYLIAGSGDSTPCDILQHIFEPPVPTVAERKNLYKFMITKFVPAMRECLQENSWKPDPDDKDSGFSMIIAFDGEVFDIGDDFSVLLNGDGIYGVGNGSKFAVGALYAGATVEKALEIAAHNDIYTSGPFLIVKQNKNEVKSKKNSSALNK